MRSLKLTLAYDGTSFVGWQRQAEGTSIQGLLETILTAIDGAPVSVAGAGRTDAGVHALAQVASCTLASTLDADTLRRALNAQLPADVRVLDGRGRAGRVSRPVLGDGQAIPVRRGQRPRRQPLRGPQRVASDRTARSGYDAAGRSATSSAHTTSRRSSPRAPMWPTPSAPSPCAEVADVTDRPPSPLPAEAVPGGRLLAFEVAANGFLRHMVRAMAGTLVEVGQGRRDPDLRRPAGLGKPGAGRPHGAGARALVG